MPEPNTRAGFAERSSWPSASSNGCHASVEMRPYSSSPAPGTPCETFVEESTTGGFTAAPWVRAGLAALTTRVAGDRSPGCAEVTLADYRGRPRGGRSRSRATA